MQHVGRGEGVGEGGLGGFEGLSSAMAMYRLRFAVTVHIVEG